LTSQRLKAFSRWASAHSTGAAGAWVGEDAVAYKEVDKEVDKAGADGVGWV
jgi:hypothetical protein